MARPRREQTEDTPAGAEAPAAREANPRISITLDDSGAVAWDRMRPATQEQLKAAFAKDPNAAQRLGLAGEAAAANADGLDSATLAHILYSSASTLMIGLARRSGYTAEQAGVLAFTQNEVQLLAEPTGKVLNKWLPTGKYQDEMMLGLLLTTIISGKLALLKKTAPVMQLVPNAGGPQNPNAAAAETLST